MQKENIIYDLIVIGGGPAGMLAAGRASENGARVLLLEKNNKLGVKLLITGNGRCNLTNAEFNLSNLIKKYCATGKFLYSALNKFGPQSVMDFFTNKNLPVKIENNNRVFPKNERAKSVVEVLQKYLENNKVDVILNAGVKDIILKNNKIEKVILKDRREFFAKNFAVCTGGKSYPLTGSTGDGYNWLSKMGHTLRPSQPALTPINLKENFVKDLEGLSLQNVAVNIFAQNKKVLTSFGEMIFTRTGLSGPMILDVSQAVGQLLSTNAVKIEIDLKSKFNLAELDQELQNLFKDNNNKTCKNVLNFLLPNKLIPVVLNLSKINPDKKVNSITKSERQILIHLLKHFSFEIKDLAGFDTAMLTAGGVDVKEVDPKTLRSKIVSNLFLAGEILDVSGPTGGFNLQICWSTGFCVGESFAKK